MGNKGFKVSICIPAYNNAQSVERLLSSIEMQSCRDFEVILTDDSEGDEIERLVQGKTYVKYYKNRQRLGSTENWNEAIARSGGEYIKIMHHDDWFANADSLKEFVGMLDRHPEAALAFSGTRQVGEENSYERCISDMDVALIKQDYRNLYLGNTIGSPSAVIVRRSALEEAGGIVYDKKLSWLVDMEYYMQILKENPYFVYTTEPLVCIGVGSEQLTEQCRDDKELNASEYGYIFQKYDLGEKREYREKLVSVLLEAGKSSREAAAYGIGKSAYEAEERRKRLGKVKWKLTHMCSGSTLFVLLLLVFTVSLFPILSLADVNHATGDDFGYGKLTHQAWETAHSLPEVMKAAGETVRQFYYGWQGTWFSIFLFTLQPEVFSPDAYVIVPYLMLALWLGSTGLLTRYLLVKKGGFREEYWGILFLLFAAAGIQFVPSTKSAIFWYNGNAHYTIPYAIALCAVYLYLRFTEEESGRGIGCYIGLTVCMAALGGCNYQAALLAPLVMVLLALFQWADREKRKKLTAFALPLALEMTGLIVSMKAPGNKARGGEEFGFHISAVVGTIFSCFVRGGLQAYEYIREHPLLLLLFAFAALVVWYMPRGEKKRYPLPVLFAGLSYCVYCACFAPEIYAGVEVSGGVYNMNYYMFLFLVFGNLIYAEGALVGRRKKRERPKLLLPLAAVAALGVLLVFKGDMKTTTSFACLSYIRSGQAADFKRQADYQQAVLLDKGVRDVVLPLLNDDQGPLMHMPITDNPDAWTNRVVKEFYGKDSVVGVFWEDWADGEGEEDLGLE